MKVCKDVAILKDEETTTNSSMYVNKVPKENKAEFVGGMILPGINLMQKSLHVGTAALPIVTKTTLNNDSIFGKNTQQTMVNGTFAAVIGAMNSMVEAIKYKYQQLPCLILSGGDANLIQQNFLFF